MAKVKQKSKSKANGNRGAPIKPDAKKVSDYHHLRNEQWWWFEEYASEREESPLISLRRAADWFIKAVDEAKVVYNANRKLEQAEKEELSVDI